MNHRKIGAHLDPETQRMFDVLRERMGGEKLAGSQKHIRDGLADQLQINDNDPRVEWRYAQEKGKPGEYAVKVVIEAMAIMKGETR